MPNSSYPLDAYLIIDNNAIANLCEFFCDSYKHQIFPDMVKNVCEELTTIFNGLRRFALDGKLFTTKNVQAEFKPEKGEIQDYQGFDRGCCNQLKTLIQNEVIALDINNNIIPKLRGMSHAPAKFGEGLSRISDPDLSLVVLAMGIAKENNQRVYILTDEEDLKIFISWMKNRPEARALCPCCAKVDGLHSMMYMDIAHRQCAFSTLQISTMMTYLAMRQMRRTMLHGSTKGEMISNTFQIIYEAFQESGRIKQQIMGEQA